jgi:hypothetical protein
MDHHCPAIGKCVALRNHQPFLVLLHWSSLATFCYVFIAIYARSLARTRMRQRLLSFVAIMVVILFVSIFFFLLDQMSRVRRNVTTIERRFHRSFDFDLGIDENMSQVFGRAWHRRWWPRVPDLSGFEWEISLSDFYPSSGFRFSPNN